MNRPVLRAAGRPGGSPIPCHPAGPASPPPPRPRRGTATCGRPGSSGLPASTPSAFGGAGILRHPPRARPPGGRDLLDSNLLEGFQAVSCGAPSLELGFKPGFQINRFSKLEIDRLPPGPDGDLPVPDPPRRPCWIPSGVTTFRVDISGSGRLIGGDPVRTGSGVHVVRLGQRGARRGSGPAGGGRLRRRGDHGSAASRPGRPRAKSSGLRSPGMCRVRDDPGQPPEQGSGRVPVLRRSPGPDSKRHRAPGSVERAGAR
ncbi:MAG: hypothetical protein MZV70_69790 [Desulfobacterales bacterium]|nr:hypothetical protein [Desulfobacterales bacterium]